MLPSSVFRSFTRQQRLVCRRSTTSSPQRFASTSSPSSPKYEAPGAPQPNKHREFYASYGLPLTKVFLGALLTYQVLYWGWMKLESLETKAKNDAEIGRLEAQVDALRKSAMVQGEAEGKR